MNEVGVTGGTTRRSVSGRGPGNRTEFVRRDLSMYRGEE